VRALKALTIIMGVMLVVGVVALVAVVAGRINRSASVPRALDVSTIDLPAGSRIATMQASGDRLFLLLDGAADGRQRLLVLDARTGAGLGTIEARPAAAP